MNATVSGNIVSGASGNAAAIAVAGNVGSFGRQQQSSRLQQPPHRQQCGAAITRSWCNRSGRSTHHARSRVWYRQPGHRHDQHRFQQLLRFEQCRWQFTTNWARSLPAWYAAATRPSGSGNLTGSDPKLLALAFNGGSTRTHALARPVLPSTPAATASLTADQRGSFARSYGSTVDMGHSNTTRPS